MSETVESLAILVNLQAKRGRERELETFLKSALTLAQAEPKTIRWYALKLDESRFAIFDTFADKLGRDAHLSGEIAQALFARGGELLDKPPVIDQPEILAVKDSLA
jgi:quinol monooxygenase YgiN